MTASVTLKACSAYASDYSHKEETFSDPEQESKSLVRWAPCAKARAQLGKLLWPLHCPESPIQGDCRSSLNRAILAIRMQLIGLCGRVGPLRETVARTSLARNLPINGKVYTQAMLSGRPSQVLMS